MHKNIAVLMGGYSSEYEISLQSGATVVEALDSSKYNVYPVHILKEKWVALSNGKEFPIDKADFSFHDGTQKVRFQACYNTIHGTPGEDGKLQAYLEIIGIPQTSSGFYASAVSFNKRDTLSILRPYGIEMAESVFIDKGDVDVYAFAKAQVHKKNVGYPCFVKPNRAGSSYGVSKVYEESKLAEAIDIAFTEDEEVLIESFLSGTEVSVGVYNYNGMTEVLPVCEIVPDGDFFDLSAKYSGKSEEIVPARISDQDTQVVQDLTCKIYELLKLKGICRLDFIFHNGTPHFVEANSNPGLSKESIVPRQAKAAGISLQDLFGRTIEAVLK